MMINFVFKFLKINSEDLFRFVFFCVSLVVCKLIELLCYVSIFVNIGGDLMVELLC